MFTSASGRSALILTAALVCFAAPSQPAGAADDAVKAERSDAAAAPVTLPKQASHSSQRSKKHAARRSGKNVGKSDAVPNANATDQRDGTAVIPASVANANAQWQYTETPTGAAKAMSARAASILVAAAQPQPDSQIVSADQLNDVDRALHPSSPPASIPPAATLSMAAADVAASPASTPVVTKGGSAWEQTSLIGKIFIGFGALLTMASAARMFMT